MTPLLLFIHIVLSVLDPAQAASPPILSKSLTSQLTPFNPAVSSTFLIPSSSALLVNASSPFPALRVPPSWSFSIGFSGSTFTPPPGGPQDLSYTALLENGDPIPDWLVLSRDSITFGGVTPKESQGVQVLRIVVTASTSSNQKTSDAFTLIVSAHDLSLSGPLLTRNVTANNAFSITLDDWQGIQVDGAHPSYSSLALGSQNANHSDWTISDSANLSLSLDISSFSWLSYDISTCTLSGTPPASLSGTPVPVIPALVKLTFGQPAQSLTVSTNLTLVVISPLFTDPTLPALQAPPGTNIAFALAPFLSKRGPLHRRVDSSINGNNISGMNVSAAWDPQNTTWLAFDQQKLILSGTVPQDAPGKVQVVFVAWDDTSGTVSRAQMRIDVDGGDGNGQGRFPTDHALRRTGKKIKLAVGVVFGVAAAVILLACFLAICRQCCVAREHVDGAYVIDQSAFDQGAPCKSSLEKHEHGYASPEINVVDTTYLAPSSTLYPPVPAPPGHTMTKAAFFDAVRTRFGSDGSWRAGRGKNRNVSGAGGNGGGGSLFGSAKRARKSKISKPMVMLSSSTSVRDGFAERGRGRSAVSGAGGGGIGSLVNGAGKATAERNFTIFGGGNNAGGGEGTDEGRGTVQGASVPPLRLGRPDVLPLRAIGRVFVSSPGTAILAYDRSRSNSDPSRASVHESTGTGTGTSQDKRRSGSAPSLGTGTRSGTVSTFATGDSTRLTNAAGEVPFRRPGFDGRWETLAERHLREAGEALAMGQKSTGTIGAERGIGSPIPSHGPSPFFPPRALVRGAGGSASRLEESRSNGPPGASLTPPKTGMASKPPTPPQLADFSGTPSKSSKATTPSKSITSGNSSNKSSPLNPRANTSSNFGSHSQTRSGTLDSALKPTSERSLAAPSTYRKVFFGDKGNESDSSVEDAEGAVITQVVNRSSSETPIIVKAPSSKSGKPRLVAFTHERTAAASGQTPRRDVSQKAVLQSSGGDDSDPEAEMRMGLEYVRQLGGPDSNHEGKHAAASKPSTSRISLTSDPSRTPSAEYYASNDSNNSIAGRTRVLAPLVISSHRNRHAAAQSMASTHDSFLSLAEHEGGLPRESRWMVESELPRFAFSTKEPFNFAVPLNREHKHASALAGSALEARQADGRALPEWLRFDKGGKEFWGVTPRAATGEKGAGLMTRVVVKIWDGEKGEVVGGCVVDVLGDRE